MTTERTRIETPNDWPTNRSELIDQMLTVWEQAYRQGNDLSPLSIYPDCPVDVLEEVADGIECLKQFDQSYENPHPVEPSPTHLEGYQIIEVIDEGGQGLVLLAEDPRLGRRLAIKTVREGCFQPALARLRLEQEARIAGSLEHPGVIPVYGSGNDSRGDPWYAMRYVATKRTLRAAIDDVHNLKNPSERTIAFSRLLGNFVTVCRAVEYAHSRNVIHRDLKPDNVLVGEYGEVFVTDFGIARELGGMAEGNSDPAETASQQSGFGTVGPMGTAPYLSPEQATDAASVGTLSDVYGLGATLYHLLTGQEPFGPFGTIPHQGTTKEGDVTQPAPQSRLNILERVKTGDFLPPRRVSSAVPPPLEAVCLKAMSLSPSDRYSSAKDLGDEIERWLADEPVKAHPEPFPTRARRWMKRHRTIVTGATASFLVAIVALLASSVLLAGKNKELHTANVNKDSALKDAKKANRNAQLARNVAEKQRNAAQSRAEQLAKSLYRNQFLLAGAAWQNKNFRQAERLLNECDQKQRGFEWYYLKRILASSQPNRTVKIKGVLEQIAINVRGDHVWLNRETKLGLGAGSTLGGGHVPCRVALHPAHKYRAFVGKRSTRDARRFPVTLYRAWIEDGELHKKKWGTLESTLRIFDVVFVDKGERVLTAGEFRVPGKEEYRIEFKLWETAGGKLLRTVNSSEIVWSGPRVVGDVTLMARFSPDGRFLAVQKNGIAILDTVTGKLLSRVKVAGTVTRDMAFRPGKAQLATVGTSGAIQLWDVQTGNPVQTLWGHKAELFALAFSPSGDQIISAGRDQTIRIWNLKDGKPTRVLPSLDEEVYAVALMPDGEIISGGSEGVVRFWDADPKPEALIRKYSGSDPAVAVGPNGLLVTSRGMDGKGEVRIVRLDAPEKVIHQWKLDYTPALAVSRGGSWLATAGRKQIDLWRLPSGKKIRALENVTGPIEFHPDGKTLFAVAVPAEANWQRTTVVAINPQSGKVRFRLPGHGLQNVHCLAVRPDGKQLAVSFGSRVVVWDLTEQKELHEIVNPDNNGLEPIAYSPDNRHLVTVRSGVPAVEMSVVQMWSTSTWKVDLSIEAHREWLTCVDFSPDGRRLVTASFDRKGVKLWDVASGQLLWTFAEPRDKVRGVVFSPEGDRLIAVDGHSGRGETLIWDAPPRER